MTEENNIYLSNETDMLNSVWQIAPNKDSRTWVLFYYVMKTCISNFCGEK